jgi:hypothetical protein
MTATEEEFAQTLASYENAAIRTGQWNGTDAVEFSNDGAAWAPVWTKTDAFEFPAFARARVHRVGVEHADWQYVSWAESIPAVDDWRALWERKPMKLFGAYAQRSAIRHAFRDVIGDRRDPDEVDPAAPLTAPVPAPERDWDADLENASTVEQLTEVWAAARTARARTAPREVVFERRLAQLEQVESDAWGEPGTPAPRPTRPVLRDHLPASSSATKRRKKRGRR